MDALDCPDGSISTPVRSQSTTAVQAFALLNNAFVIRQCEHIAARVKMDTPDGAEVAHAYRLLLQRPPSTDELKRLTDYTQKHGLANAIHVIINSNEFLHLD